MDRSPDGLDDTPDSFEEPQARWAPNMVVGLGRAIGVVASNPIGLVAA